MGVAIFEHFIRRPGKGDVALIWSLRHHAKAFFCDAKEREIPIEGFSKSERARGGKTRWQFGIASWMPDDAPLLSEIMGT